MSAAMGGTTTKKLRGKKVGILNGKPVLMRRRVFPGVKAVAELLERALPWDETTEEIGYSSRTCASAPTWCCSAGRGLSIR